MPKKIIYNAGDIVGKQGCIFIEELAPHIRPSYKDRRAIFLCGCKRHFFEASIDRVRNHNSVCPECRSEHKSIACSTKSQLIKGEYIDPDKKIRFLEELAPIRKHNRQYRVVRVFDEKHNEEFVARLQDIRSGNTTRGKRGRYERYKEVYNDVKDRLLEGSKKIVTKYHCGDLFGPHNEIELLEIVGKKNNKRMGKFYNKITNKTFITSINQVATGHAYGSIVSRGEDLIDCLLQKLQLSFLRQYTFEDCTNPDTNYRLKFDFYLPDYNTCIEYDGEQHFKYKNNGWNNKENFESLLKRDKIKDEYCKKKGIKLIRIPYFDYSKINEQYLLDLITKDIP